MGGPTEEALGLTSPETDFLARVWTLLEADATFAATVKTTVKMDGSPHDLDDPAACEMPRVDVYPTGSTEGWESNVQHNVLLTWAVDIRVRGWDKVNAYGLMHLVRNLLIDRDNFDTLHTGTSVVHEVTSSQPQLHGEKGNYHTQLTMNVTTKLRVSR